MLTKKKKKSRVNFLGKLANRTKTPNKKLYRGQNMHRV